MESHGHPAVVAALQVSNHHTRDQPIDKYAGVADLLPTLQPKTSSGIIPGTSNLDVRISFTFQHRKKKYFMGMRRTNKRTWTKLFIFSVMEFFLFYELGYKWN